jgi:hypothetical protein
VSTSLFSNLVKKSLQHLKTKTGMSAEKRARSDAVEKEEREERSALLLEKVSRQLDTRNELAEKANVLAERQAVGCST